MMIKTRGGKQVDCDVLAGRSDLILRELKCFTSGAAKLGPIFVVKTFFF